MTEPTEPSLLCRVFQTRIQFSSYTGGPKLLVLCISTTTYLITVHDLYFFVHNTISSERLRLSVVVRFRSGTSCVHT
jgi:hypothetical protein